MIDFQIKICGVRSEADVHACESAGADCVGLNFYPQSIRYLAPHSAITKSINEAAKDAKIARVGLFVNEPVAAIRRVQDALQLDAVQLHGDETPAAARQLIDAGVAIIRAIRLSTMPQSPEQIQNAILPWADLPVTLLLDADAGVKFGGGGKQLDWPSIAAWNLDFPRLPGQPDWILAGGLHCDNVADAIRTSGTKRVDVASGVESPKGTKSAELIQKFVAECRQRGVDAER
ncbi:phosphoribosylanthranilate isomerase [Rhodopirellula sp. SWK7]|uniref:phosphoribosylanthranilate isomerase n=1 Tax=Rhodopirellula sp. SWK7 TaxID=595460 RepID=UPI0002BEA5A9|nr:phosphoribosylanthranilate isomerase [Rhodopirellula sp. SWK7]EMI42101.1 N-(5-phosphoribosyl)anthranilate isomerase [Rhodopirellula sp. SWK7]